MPMKQISCLLFIHFDEVFLNKRIRFDRCAANVEKRDDVAGCFPRRRRHLFAIIAKLACQLAWAQ